LAHVLVNGWTWGPMICDAYEHHQRTPWWLAMYAVLLPAAGLVGDAVWSWLGALARYLLAAWRKTRSSRLRQIAIGLAGLSVLAHLTYVNHIRRGGMVNLSTIELVLHDAGEVASVLLLPLTVVNRLLILVLAALNRHVSDWFWPSPQWPDIRGQAGIFGGYNYSGCAWELFQAIVLLLFWVLVINLVADAMARLRRN
jgi:hypothetical protein